MNTVTINITNDMKRVLDDQVKAGWFDSMNDAVKAAMRFWVEKKELTENGFTREVEEEILRSEKSPVTGVWKSKEDIHEYFEKLRAEIKAKKN